MAGICARLEKNLDSKEITLRVISTRSFSTISEHISTLSDAVMTAFVFIRHRGRCYGEPTICWSAVL